MRTDFLGYTRSRQKGRCSRWVSFWHWHRLTEITCMPNSCWTMDHLSVTHGNAEIFICGVNWHSWLNFSRTNRKKFWMI